MTEKNKQSMGSILLKLLNRLLDVAVLLTLLVTALYCVYCIWDNNTIYDAPLKLQQELRKQRPKEESPSFEELQRLNPDVAAWLTLEGTGIDDPIVQGEDNLEYLNKNVYGEYALAGSIFLDSRCDRTFRGAYQLVYGHHMEKHRMFGDLDRYLEEDFVEEHTTGTLMVPGKTYPLMFLAVMKVDAADSCIFEPQDCGPDSDVFQQAVLTKGQYVRKELLEKLSEETDSWAVLALSTCSSEKEEERIVVLMVYERK